jgi:hypothetical protein
MTDPVGSGPGGVPIYRRPLPSGFILFAEFKRPPDLRPIGTSTFNANPNLLPDFQVAVTRLLGNGSAAVCDDGPAPAEPAGGVPAIAGGDFGANPPAVNDFSCRFDARTATGTGPCTRNGFGVEVFRSTDTVLQFCAIIGAELAFQEGDTVVTVRARDTLGRVGQPMSMIVRVDPQ